MFLRTRSSTIYGSDIDSELYNFLKIFSTRPYRQAKIFLLPFANRKKLGNFRIFKNILFKLEKDKQSLFQKLLKVSFVPLAGKVSTSSTLLNYCETGGGA